MFSLLATGHTKACPIPEEACTCESTQYAITGVLAIVAGVIQGSVGYYKSMALLSDSLHAIADGLSDFWGVYISEKVKKHTVNKHDEDAIRAKGNKVIAFLLFAGAISIMFEAVGRWNMGEFFVSPLFIALIGFMALVINSIRWMILSKAQKTSHTSTRTGLIAHAKSDAVHSAVVTFSGVLFLIAGMLSMSHITILWWTITPQDIDIALSLALGAWMIVLSYKIWNGEDHCGHGHDHNHSDHHHH